MYQYFVRYIYGSTDLIFRTLYPWLYEVLAKVRVVVFEAILSPSERYQNIQDNPECNSVLPFRIILKIFVVNILVTFTKVRVSVQDVVLSNYVREFPCLYDKRTGTPTKKSYWKLLERGGK